VPIQSISVTPGITPQVCDTTGGEAATVRVGNSHGPSFGCESLNRIRRQAVARSRRSALPTWKRLLQRCWKPQAAHRSVRTRASLSQQVRCPEVPFNSKFFSQQDPPLGKCRRRTATQYGSSLPKCMRGVASDSAGCNGWCGMPLSHNLTRPRQQDPSSVSGRQVWWSVNLLELARP
jgi:hypothetical protein